MSDSPTAQRVQVPSPLTRMTAITAQGANALTYWGNKIVSCGLVLAGSLSLLGGALLPGMALLFGAVVQNLLARDAGRARHDIRNARAGGSITGPLSARHLLSGIGRAALTPLLLTFNLSAALPPIVIEMAAARLNNQTQGTQNCRPPQCPGLTPNAKPTPALVKL